MDPRNCGLDNLAWHFGQIALDAGATILSIRAKSLVSAEKADGSLVTEADIQADKLISTRLQSILPGVPLVSEESSPLQSRALGAIFLLVDPLDGTREFVAGRDEFTVNIGLIESGRPIAGAVYAPALRQLYVGGETARRAHVQPSSQMPALENMQRIHTRLVGSAPLRAVASRSHLDSRTAAWLSDRGIDDVLAAGSSLKFCAVAEGAADVYPRLSPTMEWDTAAGHAILNAAGGCVLGLDEKPLVYGKRPQDLKNEGFVGWGSCPISDTQPETSAP